MDIWKATHQARQDLADDLAGLDDAQWRQPTLCAEWDVEHVVAHLSAAASVGKWAWMRSIVGSGFRPTVHNDRRLREHLGSTPRETLEIFGAVINSTVAPTGDLPAYLGEVIVHSEDIRYPLGLPSRCDVDAATEVARFYVSRNFTVNSKSAAAGLKLRATDGPFSAGDGPEVSGPTLALVMAMAGRRSDLDQLTGDGMPLLVDRLDRGAAR
ncbi:maleylpyruvate isomerase family mycothiol-dependent enzyme [Dietzia aurantiaca]|mgnify:CR=1 FL=1|uniref:maleylpyruvate isomerase family mycothiol-dependent enzyme n=1 Tax=Dietzia aurantiaca TaxID=983873 RepID=UPI001E63A95D|nr:maleylpyruvate isomerase family mycothiol-dependent enzyme [Dietzia aurantiaca]MCD2262715.1 maleylpyruvate isomerase family mycothiol-dependent enzyme [Dietzia aurantiaca]